MSNQKHEVLHMEEGKLTPQRIDSAIRRLPIQTQQRMDSIQALATIDEISHAIAECTTIELAKYYDNKIDALAALAKILKDDKITVEAKRAKLLNYRKLGEIAESLRPTKFAQPLPLDREERRLHINAIAVRVRARKRGAQIPKSLGGNSRPPGAQSLLKEHGFSQVKSTQILQVSRVPENVFKDAVGSPNPPPPRRLAIKGINQGGIKHKNISSDLYRSFRAESSGCNAGRFITWCRSNNPAELARGMTPDEATKARETVIEIQEWLDTFERHLHKEVK